MYCLLSAAYNLIYYNYYSIESDKSLIYAMFFFIYFLLPYIQRDIMRDKQFNPHQHQPQPQPQHYIFTTTNAEMSGWLAG